ncbi:MAG TPA: hypothetical protein VF982_00240 [Anaerolineales bacterium]
MPVTHVPVTIAIGETAVTILSENSGLTHYVLDLTSTCTFTLPSPAAGLWFDFVCAADAAEAQNWVIDTGSDTNYFQGGLVFLDQDGDAIAPIDGDGNSNSKLTIVTPEPGTRIRVESGNGTTWILSGYVLSATTPSFADQ